jgi:hypothetical protein
MIFMQTQPLRAAIALWLGCAISLLAQAPDLPPEDGPPPDGGPGFDGPPPFGPGGFGPGGPGGMHQVRKLVKQFDRDGNGWLNGAERKAAREFLAKEGGSGFRGPGGRGGRFFGPGESQAAGQPGPKLSPSDVKTFSEAPLYATNVLRTFFLEFEDPDWEQELAAFKNTDVEVPAKLTVDGKTYRDVGVHFHGASSFMMVGEGRKRSLVLSLDAIQENQRLGGYRKINLLNSHEDPSFLRTVLSLQIAREYMPAPKANFARVVINGESWGLYVNQQHFNKDFTRENFGSSKGARWKVTGSPNGRGGLEYLGDDPAAYRSIYEIKSNDDPRSWARFIQLCKVLNQAPPDQLEKQLAPLLDIESTLKFLAWENTLVNGDGFWTRASDYDLFLDEHGVFHVIPYDANETFSLGGGGGPGGPPGFRPGSFPRHMFGPPGGGRRRGGPGFGPGMAGGGVKLDPLVSVNDASKPLLSKLLAVPSLQASYLRYVHDIAERSLDWNRLGPIVQQYVGLIADDVKADTRKLDSEEDFLRAVSAEGGNGDSPRNSLKDFAEQRRTFLLNNPAVKKAAL